MADCRSALPRPRRSTGADRPEIRPGRDDDRMPSARSAIPEDRLNALEATSARRVGTAAGEIIQAAGADYGARANIDRSPAESEKNGMNCPGCGCELAPVRAHFLLRPHVKCPGCGQVYVPHEGCRSQQWQGLHACADPEAHLIAGAQEETS